MFFKNLTAVGMDMQTQLSLMFDKECYSRIQSLQLSSADLPNKFEGALQDTNVAQQEVITVANQQKNAIIDMQTQVSQAKIAAPVVVNNAEAKVNATVTTNLAQMKAYLLVTQSEADAYKEMQSQLGFSDDVSILRYIKVKAINGYNQKNLIVGVNPTATPAK